MKNKLGYLGFIGFLGILGIVTDNKYFLAFFAFVVFFRYFAIKPDELFQLNVQKAATPAFFTEVAVQTITLAITAFTKNIAQLITGLALSFSISIVVFILILTIYEYKESRGI
ncbi:MAG: DUF3796 domain-containing protein [Anaerolineaceae bacterium]